MGSEHPHTTGCTVTQLYDSLLSLITVCTRFMTRNEQHELCGGLAEYTKCVLGWQSRANSWCWGVG